MKTLDTHRDLLRRFEGITSFLTTHRSLWEPRPFVDLTVPWEKDYPDTAQRLRSLSVEEVEFLERDPAAGEKTTGDFEQWRQSCVSWSQVPMAETHPLPMLDDKRLSDRIRGRKWSQIKAFAGAVWPLLPPEGDNLVDWCAGKGHLGRTLGKLTGLPFTAIERQGNLCEVGRAEAAAAQVSGQFFEGDIHDPQMWESLNSNSIAVALHACGILTDRLLEQAVEKDIRGLACAPCCYHALGGAKEYHPRSEAGRQSGLSLSQHNLRLATAHEVVARPSVRQARRREMAWRLGLDLLIREGSGEDHYLPLGPFPRPVLDQPFHLFCQDAARERELTLPPSFDREKAEAAGWERARIVRGLGLVRGLFRRPLEIWLVLDRALHLVEKGRRVQIHQFCETTTTPRNLLLTSRARI